MIELQGWAKLGNRIATDAFTLTNKIMHHHRLMLYLIRTTFDRHSTANVCLHTKWHKIDGSLQCSEVDADARRQAKCIKVGCKTTAEPP